MIGEVLQFRDLQELCHPGRRPRLATVERWARSLGIRFNYDAHGGIWTTTTALNQALGVITNAQNDGKYDPSELL